MKQCSLCGSTHLKHLFTAQNIHGRNVCGHEQFPIVQCHQCKVAATDICPDESYYQKYYRDDYYESKENKDQVSDAYYRWNYRYVYGLYHDEPTTHRV